MAMIRRAPRWTAEESGAERRMPPSPYHPLPIRTAGKTNGSAPREVVADAFDRHPAIRRIEHAPQQRGERPDVEDAARELRVLPRQQRADGLLERQQRGVVRGEDVVALERTPEVVELVDAVREIAVHRREVDGVDRAGGDARDDLELEVRKVARQTAQQPHLIRRPRAASGEHDREVAARRRRCRSGREVKFRHSHVLIHFKRFANFIWPRLASHAKAQPHGTMRPCGSRWSAAASTARAWRGSWPAATTT